jgi:Concanavalin A-like lectin/glucanases superfamily
MNRACTARFRFWVVLPMLLVPIAVHAARPAYHDQISASEPVLWYQFNEASGTALNYGSLGAAYDATYFGSPTRQASTLGGDGGVAFATAADYLESLGVAPAGLTGNPTFSAEALFFVPTLGGCGLWAPFLHWGPSPVDGGGPTAQSVYFSFSHDDATSAFAGFYNGGLKSAQTMPKGQWHHFIWVRVGGGNALAGTTVYIDGQDVTSMLVPDPDLPADTLTPTVGATEFRVNRARDYEASRYFVGTLDEVALYDRALTAQEAYDHYRQAIDEIFPSDFE